MFGLDKSWLGAACSLAPPQEAAAEAAHKALQGAGFTPPPMLVGPLSDAQRAGLREKLASAWAWSENAEVRGRPAARLCCLHAPLAMHHGRSTLRGFTRVRAQC